MKSSSSTVFIEVLRGAELPNVRRTRLEEYPSDAAQHSLAIRCASACDLCSAAKKKAGYTRRKRNQRPAMLETTVSDAARRPVVRAARYMHPPAPRPRCSLRRLSDY